MAMRTATEWRQTRKLNRSWHIFNFKLRCDRRVSRGIDINFKMKCNGLFAARGTTTTMAMKAKTTTATATIHNGTALPPNGEMLCKQWRRRVKEKQKLEDGDGDDAGGDGSGGGGGGCVLAATSMSRFPNEKWNESQACGKWCPKRFIFCKNIFVICSCFTMHEKALTDGALNHLHSKRERRGRERETPERAKRMNENTNRTSKQKKMFYVLISERKNKMIIMNIESLIQLGEHLAE